jgi:hypothetical protein
MSDNPGGAGPALAAHSKDGSALGPNPASAATGEARPASNNDLLQQLTEWVRQYPIGAMAVCAVLGHICGRSRGRR